MKEKTCSVCRSCLPATVDNFPRNGGGRLKGRCRPCERKARTTGAEGERRRAYCRAYNKEYAIVKPRRVRSLSPIALQKLRAKYRRSNARRRARTDHKLRDVMSSRLVKALKGTGTWNTVQPIVGYSIADLKVHLERQFKNGMSWENFGKWHIDHILPVTAFRITGADGEIDASEVRACWALSNLRPLWARDNVKKSNSRHHLL